MYCFTTYLLYKSIIKLKHLRSLFERYSFIKYSSVSLLFSPVLTLYETYRTKKLKIQYLIWFSTFRMSDGSFRSRCSSSVIFPLRREKTVPFEDRRRLFLPNQVTAVREGLNTSFRHIKFQDAPHKSLNLSGPKLRNETVIDRDTVIRLMNPMNCRHMELNEETFVSIIVDGTHP